MSYPYGRPRARDWHRGYNRAFDWEYEPEIRPPAPPPGPGGGGTILIPINWDGLPINTGDQPNGLFTCVEDVTGWLDSPPLDGHDQPRDLADGSVWGPKILNARHITITGVAIGPRPLLGQLRDDLARRASARLPAPLAITDGGLERTLVADVRAGTDAYRQSWITPTAFRWQVTLAAADPLLYEQTWREVTLTTIATGETGRRYEPLYEGPWPPEGWWTPPPPPSGWDEETDGPWEPAPPKLATEGESRAYPNWRYSSPWTPNSAVLDNEGNAEAPVYALYEGDLTETTLTDDAGGILRVAPLVAGMEILIATKTLTAETVGGLQRSSFILPGSRPIVLPPQSSTRLHLYGAGYGQVTLAWRSAWT